MKRLKSIETTGVIFGVVLGTLLHFTYEISGNNNLVALFSAVNESVWEHTKLIFFPILIFSAVELYYLKDTKRVLLAKVIESLFGISFIIIFFYTYTGVFGGDVFWVDIGYFIFTVILAKYISYRIINSKIKWQGYLSLHLAVLILLTVFYFVVTFVPPKIPIFKDESKNAYGLSR